MRITLTILAFALSGLLYVWYAAIFLWPAYMLGWSEGWQMAISHREWPEWAAIAGIAITATVLLVLDVSLTGGCRRPRE